MVTFMGDLALKPLYTISSKAVVTQTHGLQARLSARNQRCQIQDERITKLYTLYFVPQLTMETTTFEPHILIQKSIF